MRDADVVGFKPIEMQRKSEQKTQNMAGPRWCAAALCGAVCSGGWRLGVRSCAVHPLDLCAPPLPQPTRHGTEQRRAEQHGESAIRSLSRRCDLPAGATACQVASTSPLLTLVHCTAAIAGLHWKRTDCSTQLAHRALITHHHSG